MQSQKGNIPARRPLSGASASNAGAETTGQGSPIPPPAPTVEPVSPDPAVNPNPPQTAEDERRIERELLTNPECARCGGRVGMFVVDRRIWRAVHRPACFSTGGTKITALTPRQFNPTDQRPEWRDVDPNEYR